eukprot:1158291-Pelagomonas_calceolata.AAC.2
MPGQKKAQNLRGDSKQAIHECTADSEVLILFTRRAGHHRQHHPLQEHSCCLCRHMYLTTRRPAWHSSSSKCPKLGSKSHPGGNNCPERMHTCAYTHMHACMHNDTYGRVPHGRMA